MNWSFFESFCSLKSSFILENLQEVSDFQTASRKIKKLFFIFPFFPKTISQLLITKPTTDCFKSPLHFQSLIIQESQLTSSHFPVPWLHEIKHNRINQFNNYLVFDGKLSGWKWNKQTARFRLRDVARKRITNHG